MLPNYNTNELNDFKNHIMNIINHLKKWKKRSDVHAILNHITKINDCVDVHLRVGSVSGAQLGRKSCSLRDVTTLDIFP